MLGFILMCIFTLGVEVGMFLDFLLRFVLITTTALFIQVSGYSVGIEMSAM